MKFYEKTMVQKTDEMFRPGCFVMLHHNSKANGNPHPDAGRVGMIINKTGEKMLVEFFTDEQEPIGCSIFCMIPFGHWLPLPKSLIEEYYPENNKRGWRVSQKGMEIFRNMEWDYTLATEGKS